MASDEQPFLARWSRLKREHARTPDAPPPPAVPASTAGAGEESVPALPAVESLTPESDFTVFMQAKVADAVRSAALKKLFLHPEINVPDPFEPFCDDWNVGEPIPDDMLKSLLQARDDILRPCDAPTEQAHRPEGLTQDPESEGPVAQAPESTDAPGRQDA